MTLLQSSSRDSGNPLNSKLLRLERASVSIDFLLKKLKPLIVTVHHRFYPLYSTVKFIYRINFLFNMADFTV